MTVEIWKPVVGYETHYSVSDQGRVRREYAVRGTFVGRIRKPWVNKDGYLKTKLSVCGKTKAFFVHRLVTDTFLGSRPENLEVNHKNGIKTDNRAENLEYVTRLENMRHAITTGLRNCCGEKNPHARLTLAKVGWIRRIYRHGELTRKQLGDCFGVAEQTIGDIVTGRKWGTV